MRQLFPAVRDGVAPSEIIDRASRNPGPGRPWVMTNMVMSADGAYSSSGTSRAISSDADREMFQLLRASADVILVGAGTARTERYRRPRTPDDLSGLRSALHLDRDPKLAVITRGAEFPPDQPFLSGSGPDPVIFMPGNVEAPDDLASTDVRHLGTDEVDPGDVLQSLYSDGVSVVLCEGGPHLLGQLSAAGLIDEYFLTISPTLVGGNRTGLLGGVEQTVKRLELHRLIEADGHLMLTYRASQSAGRTAEAD